MITETAKAASLPPDLKDAWAELMAEKFPMTVQEVIGYVLSRYQNVEATEFNGKVVVSRKQQYRSKVFQGYDLNDPSFRSYNQMLASNGDLNAQSRLGSLLRGNSGIGQAVGAEPARGVYAYEEVVISDFKPSAIDKALKGFKK